MGSVCTTHHQNRNYWNEESQLQWGNVLREILRLPYNPICVKNCFSKFVLYYINIYIKRIKTFMNYRIRILTLMKYFSCHSIKSKAPTYNFVTTQTTIVKIVRYSFFPSTTNNHFQPASWVLPKMFWYFGFSLISGPRWEEKNLGKLLWLNALLKITEDEIDKSWVYTKKCSLRDG